MEVEDLEYLLVLEAEGGAAPLGGQAMAPVHPMLVELLLIHILRTCTLLTLQVFGGFIGEKLLEAGRTAGLSEKAPTPLFVGDNFQVLHPVLHEVFHLPFLQGVAIVLMPYQGMFGYISMKRKTVFHQAE